MLQNIAERLRALDFPIKKIFCTGCGQPIAFCQGAIYDGAGRHWHGPCARAALADLAGHPPTQRPITRLERRS